MPKALAFAKAACTGGQNVGTSRLHALAIPCHPTMTMRPPQGFIGYSVRVLSATGALSSRRLRAAALVRVTK